MVEKTEENTPSFCLKSHKGVFNDFIDFIFCGCFLLFSDVGRGKEGEYGGERFCQKEISSLKILKKEFVSTLHIRIKMDRGKSPNCINLLVSLG